MYTRKLKEDMGSSILSGELRIIHSIGLISLCGIVLYISGYAWRSCYFVKLGVPLSSVEYPIPRTLIPHMTVIVFIAQAVLTFAMLKYRVFYEAAKRHQRAKALGITHPLDELAEYAAQKNTGPGQSGRSNTEVFMQALEKHAKRDRPSNQEPMFNMEEFAEEVALLFPDLSHKMMDSFVRYELQLVTMEREELIQTVADSLGHAPKGSRVYEQVNLVLFGAITLLFIIGAVFSTASVLPTFVAAVLGVGTGFVLSYMSNIEDRYQFWHTAWMAVGLLLGVSAVDGYVTATRSRSHYSLPFVTVFGTDGTSYRGPLLGDFADSYLIEPYDVNDSCHCVKIHKQEVRLVEIRDTWRLEEASRRLRKETEAIKQKASTLQRISDGQSEEVNAPN